MLTGTKIPRNKSMAHTLPSPHMWRKIISKSVVVSFVSLLSPIVGHALRRKPLKRTNLTNHVDRLGMFGWLTDDVESANAGLLDQRLALDWVQAHVGRFGGDPGQVTVVGSGELAGALMVSVHVVKSRSISF
jgi:hypothetical protein